MQFELPDPNRAAVARHVEPNETSAVTLAFMTLPGGAEVLVMPCFSIQALRALIAPRAAPGHAASAAIKPTTATVPQRWRST